MLQHEPIVRILDIFVFSNYSSYFYHQFIPHISDNNIHDLKLTIYEPFPFL